MTTAPSPVPASLSAECQLAAQRAYRDLHSECRQTDDIPLPHGNGILLQPRCSCSCHRSSRPSR